MSMCATSSEPASDVSFEAVDNARKAAASLATITPKLIDKLSAHVSQRLKQVEELTVGVTETMRELLEQRINSLENFVANQNVKHAKEIEEVKTLFQADKVALERQVGDIALLEKRLEESQNNHRHASPAGIQTSETLMPSTESIPSKATTGDCFLLRNHYPWLTHTHTHTPAPLTFNPPQPL